MMGMMEADPGLETKEDGKQMTVQKRMKKRLFGILLPLFLAAACAGPAANVTAPAAGPEPPPENDLKRVRFWRVPAFTDDLSLESLIAAGRGSYEYYSTQPANRPYRFGSDVYTAGELKTFIKEFLTYASEHPDPDERRAYLKKNGRVYRGGAKRKKMKFTGYYEPVLDGSRLPGIQYTEPVFGLPRDIITVDLGAFLPGMKGRKIVGRYQNGTLVPYYTRHQIDRMERLAGKGYELAWVRDPVELFFLHLQGSGKILLTDGSVLNVHYAGTNGSPYRSIGRYLIEEEKIPAGVMSMDSIKKYLNEHPEKVGEILDLNERYVFFEVVSAGPVGGTGIVLTPGRSLATDSAWYPEGALGYIETEIPVPDDEGVPGEWKKVNRFVLNQDAGGGVKGPGRGDLFFGTGQTAGSQAGWMNRSGRIYFLAPDID
jgi:membrane-bound lytic murein transglycosylase A